MKRYFIFYQCLYFNNILLFGCSVMSNSLQPHGLQQCQASLSITNSQSLPKLMSFESVMPSSHLILCGPLLLPPSIFSNIRVFSNESALHIRWPKYWVSASTSVLPMNTQDWSPLGWTGWILQSKGLSRVFSSTTSTQVRYSLSTRCGSGIVSNTEHTVQSGKDNCKPVW